MATPAWYLRPEDPPSKAAILSSALHLFVRDGVCAASIRDIAADAGYSNPVLFKYFAGKEELALYLFEQCYRRLSSVVRAAVDPERSFSEGLAGLVAAYAELLDEDPDIVLYVHEHLRAFWPRITPSLRRQSIIGLIGKLVERGRREGVVATDLSADLLGSAYVGLLAQYARELYFGQFRGTAREWTPQLTRLMMRMVRP